ncbi:DUF6161 domain-containing protein [Aquimarina sp. 2304DJ70-9]|uniref:DUF6161 domain-containing protein n=1 Tax=Aquimarina penaris TaxID=3231044 RepID=UPI003461B43A
MPDILIPSKKHFESCVNKIENFVNRNLELNNSNRGQDWNNLSKQLEASGTGKDQYFNKESSTTDFLLKLDSEYAGSSEGAYDFFTNQVFRSNNSDKNYFIGWYRAYEFFTQDNNLVRRRSNEKTTLSRIRSEYLKKLQITDSQVDEHIAKIEGKYQSKEESISRLIKRKNQQYENWKQDSQGKFSNLLTQADNSFKKLEELYKEKLKLEAPAIYWKNRATTLKAEGNKWLGWLIVVIILAVLALGGVLYLISDGTLKDLFEKTGSAVRWSIVFITFVSFLAYGIKTFSKLMFSSYHLYRDAQEREQLTYVYLALVKEKGVDPTERNLIMQALFSRADSGLLRDDSTPAMPGGVLEKVIGK